MTPVVIFIHLTTVYCVTAGYTTLCVGDIAMKKIKVHTLEEFTAQWKKEANNLNKYIIESIIYNR